MATIVGGCFKVPVGFEIVAEIEAAKCKMKTPDGTLVDLVINMKSFDEKEFFESIEKFKEEVRLSQE